MGIRRWIGWALLESSMRVSGRMFSKKIGVYTKRNPALVFLATLIVGLVQVVVGFTVAKSTKKRLFGSTRNIIGASLFGVVAGILTLLSFSVFRLGGDIGVVSFIISLSIIVAALIDWLFFGHKLSKKQWTGIVIALIAGYSIMGWPSLSEIGRLPLWMWLSFLIMIGVAVNQGITKSIKTIDPFVKNFWGGLATVVISCAGLIALGSLDLLWSFRIFQGLWMWTLLAGVVVISMWVFNLMSYKRGANIAVKKIIVDSFTLVGAMFFGILVFKEPLTLAKIISLPFYIVAFLLIKKDEQ